MIQHTKLKPQCITKVQWSEQWLGVTHMFKLFGTELTPDPMTNCWISALRAGCYITKCAISQMNVNSGVHLLELCDGH